MVDPNTRQGKRTPVTLKIKFKSETLEQFIERYAVDVSQGGIFIRTKEPLAVGTQMRFEFQLRDASPLIAGEGTVVWTRENDPSRPAIAPGMGVRFDRLAEGSQTILERILSEKAKQAPQRSSDSTTKPPLFTDTPTRVAPMSVQEALLGDKRRPENFPDQHTPLPKPMPFHSDAEDFDEQAFEEATKVRALDELIAQTADGGDEGGMATAIIPADELAARRLAAGGRLDSTVADPPGTEPAHAPGPIGVAKSAIVDRDSAPGLPSPPEPSKPQPRLLDTMPSPRAVVESAGELGKTKLGFDAPPDVRRAKVSTPPLTAKAAPARPSGQQAVPSTPVLDPATSSKSAKRPVAPRAKSSAAPVVILILVLLAAGGAGVWFFYFRPQAAERNVAVDPPPKPDPGSAGSGSGGDLVESGSGSGSAAVEAPAGPMVDTVVKVSTAGATVEIVGTDQTGPAPLTAKLEQDKTYQARIVAPGFATTEMEIKGGQTDVDVKLVAKPRVVSVTTVPAGALIFVDNAATGHTTPHDVELTKAQAAKKTVKITVRKSGYRPIEKLIATDAYKESDSQLVATVEERLSVQVIRTPPPPPPDRGSGSNTGSAGSAAVPANGSGSGSAAPANTGSGSTGSGAGSATKPPTPTTGSGSAAGSAAKPPSGSPTPTAGSATAKPPGSEPEPDFLKK